MCWYLSLMIYIAISGSVIVRSQFLLCSDDSTFEPEEGIMDELQFNWLGILQYIHVKNGTPHYFRAPRVILISRQFVLATAKDAAQVPEEYALGNVIFGDYERDEDECGQTPEDFAKGSCDPAVVTVPLVDVLLHPEYKHFGAENSVALLKMVISLKSAYMIPVCLPFRDYLSVRIYSTNYTLWHVDFASSVPRDFFDEEKEVTRLNLLPQALCFLYDEAENTTTEVAKRRVMCTTDCDFHSGAPTVLHEHTGHWTAVSLAEGSAPCPDPLRSGRPPPPPRHIKLHPYVPWITAALTGKTVKAVTSSDPFGYSLPRQAVEKHTWKSWVGHWWLAGLQCFDRGYTAAKYYRFYHELFTIKPGTKKRFTYFLQINGVVGTKIICVKVRMDYRTELKIWNLETAEVMFAATEPFMGESDSHLAALFNNGGAVNLRITKYLLTHAEPDQLKLRIPIGALFELQTFEVEAWATEDQEMKIDAKDKDLSPESITSSDDESDSDVG